MDFYLNVSCGTDQVVGVIRVEEHLYDDAGDLTQTVLVASVDHCVDIPWRSGVGPTDPVPAVTENIAGGIVERALPRPVLGISPDGQGLVNLETYYWFVNTSELDAVDHDRDGGTPPRLQVSIDEVEGPYHLQGTAWVERWLFDTGAQHGGARRQGCSESATVVRWSDRPGTPDHPAAAFTYEQSGDYRLCAGVVWNFEFSWELLDGTGRAGAGSLPPLTVWSTPRDWHVHEVRGYVTG